MHPSKKNTFRISDIVYRELAHVLAVTSSNTVQNITPNIMLFKAMIATDIDFDFGEFIAESIAYFFGYDY